MVYRKFAFRRVRESDKNLLRFSRERRQKTEAGLSPLPAATWIPLSLAAGPEAVPRVSQLTSFSLSLRGVQGNDSDTGALR